MQALSSFPFFTASFFCCFIKFLLKDTENVITAHILKYSYKIFKKYFFHIFFLG